ncbi:MAG TPA: DUF2752 domain-containing protein [Clostridiales bacterium]|nr:DUF2752 domain-containing protein [Clostridiales bacterium]
MFSFNKFRKHKKEIGILALGIISLSVFVYFKDPFEGPILPCLFNKITGFYCPGCGMTRAVNSIFNLKFYQAFSFNALIFIMPIPLAIYYVVDYKKKPRMAKYILILMVIIAVGYGVLRNIPHFDFLVP